MEMKWKKYNSINADCNATLKTDHGHLQKLQDECRLFFQLCSANQYQVSFPEPNLHISPFILLTVALTF